MATTAAAARKSLIAVDVPKLGKGSIHPGVVFPGDVPPVITGERLVYLAQTGQYLGGLAQFDADRVTDRKIKVGELRLAAKFAGQWAEEAKPKSAKARNASKAAETLSALADQFAKPRSRSKATGSVNPEHPGNQDTAAAA